MGSLASLLVFTSYIRTAGVSHAYSLDSPRPHDLLDSLSLTLQTAVLVAIDSAHRVPAAKVEHTRVAIVVDENVVSLDVTPADSQAMQTP